MAGDPNLQIDPKKAIPAPDNILHQFKNYTYKISLLSFKSYQRYNDMAEGGSWPFMFGFVPGACYTLFSSGGVANVANEILPVRHPKFDVDFYISSLSMNSMMGMNLNTRATNVMDLSMAVVEPVGTTLLDRLHAVLTEDGANWTEHPLLIQIDFLGYDEGENPVRIKPATRWIPVRLANLDFSIGAEGTNYTIEFIVMSVLEANTNPLNRSLNLKTLRGDSLQSILDNIAGEFNRDQQERAKEQTEAGIKPNETPKIIAPRSQQFPDEIEFRLGSGGGPEAALLKDAKISPNVARQTLLRKVPREVANAELPPSRRAAATQFKYNTDLRYYGERKGPNGEDYKIEIAAPGQSMISLIEKLIRDSTYITDQIADSKLPGTQDEIKKVLKDPDAGLNWFKITYVKILKDYDNVRNCYSRKTIVQIDPYKSSETQATGSNIKPGDNGLRKVARSYNYIYSGQNLDIKNLDLSFNNAFILAMTGVETKNATSDEPTVNQEANQTTSPDSGNMQDGTSVIGAKQTVQTANNKFIPDPFATNKQRTGATLMENLYRMPGSDMMSIQMEIVGDPCYIQQDGILTMTTPNKAGNPPGNGPGHDTTNGAILCDMDDAHFYLLFKTPRDYNEATGLADFSNSFGGSTLSGFYRVWEVNSIFQGGEFTQTIQATRIYSQFRENLDGPKGQESMSEAERTAYDFEDVKAAQIASIAGPPVQAAVGIDAFGGIGAQVGATPYDAGEFEGITLPEQARIKELELQIERSDVDMASRLESFTTDDTKSRNFVNPHADFNVQAFSNQDTRAADFRAAEARATRLEGLSTISQSSGTIAAQLSNIPANTTPIRPTPADATGPIRIRSSSPVTQANVSPPVLDNTGRVLYTPRGNPHGVVGLNPNINTSSYAFEDQKAITNNNNIERTERQNVIDLTTAGLAIAGAAAWRRGNSASEDSKLRHGKYGNGYNSWKDHGYLTDIIPIDPLTGQ